jgi:hypothetical protein
MAQFEFLLQAYASHRNSDEGVRGMSRSEAGDVFSIENNHFQNNFSMDITNLFIFFGDSRVSLIITPPFNLTINLSSYSHIFSPN